MRWGLALVIVCGCSSSADRDVTRARCVEVRDRWVELRLRDATGVDVNAHRAAMKQALGDAFIDRCHQDMGPEHVACVLEAKDQAAASACTRTASK